MVEEGGKLGGLETARSKKGLPGLLLWAWGGARYSLLLRIHRQFGPPHTPVVKDKVKEGSRSAGSKIQPKEDKNRLGLGGIICMFLFPLMTPITLPFILPFTFIILLTINILVAIGLDRRR